MDYIRSLFEPRTDSLPINLSDVSTYFDILPYHVNFSILIYIDDVKILNDIKTIRAFTDILSHGGYWYNKYIYEFPLINPKFIISTYYNYISRENIIQNILKYKEFKLAYDKTTGIVSDSLDKSIETEYYYNIELLELTDSESEVLLNADELFIDIANMIVNNEDNQYSLLVEMGIKRKTYFGHIHHFDDYIVDKKITKQQFFTIIFDMVLNHYPGL